MARSNPTRTRTRTLTLIPGLPNHLSAIILSYIPYPYHPKFKQVSKSWAHFYAYKKPLIFSLRHVNPHYWSHLLVFFPQDPSLTSPYLFDPTRLAWAPLPPMPVNPHAYSLSNFSAFSVNDGGPQLLVLGGSLFDTRTFPLHAPSPSPAFFRYNFISSKWTRLAPMNTARGSFAVAEVGSGKWMVAGGGSRHVVFGAAGSRVGSAERYDVEEDRWVPVEGLPGERAGCVGFSVRKGKSGGREFWVMGGYSGTHAMHGVLPVDEYCRDAVVLEVDKGRWREVGDMWGVGERMRLGKVAVIQEKEKFPGVYMLDEDNIIFRYEMALNRWFKESTVPRNCQDGSSFGFVALQGELFVISLMQGFVLSEIRRSRQRRRGTVLYMQIYNPGKKSWRSLVTRSPFQCPIDFKTAVMCTIHV